jgi:N-acylneuraminate cytidylyltransferase
MQTIHQGTYDQFLVVIPARGGSKGVKDKNIRLLGGKPLLCHAIEAARQCLPGATICVSSDSSQIIEVAQAQGLEVPFVRPAHMSTDTAGDYEVMLHALQHYSTYGKQHDVVVKWQPTTPFRRAVDIRAAVAEYSADLDMIVGVKEAKANPYFTLFEESSEGYLEPSKRLSGVTRRQDAPSVYQYNGALYLINASSLRRCSAYNEFQRVKKFVMSDLYSIDIDTELDLLFSEFLLESQMIKSEWKGDEL